MDIAQTNEYNEHVIDIITQDRQVNGSNSQHNEDLVSSTSSVSETDFQHSWFATTARKIPFARRPMSYEDLMCIMDFLIIPILMIPSIIILSSSRHEHPHSSLFTWILVYVYAWVATLLSLPWRITYFYDIQVPDQYLATRLLSLLLTNTRIRGLVACLIMALDCFYFVWWLVGIVLVSRHSSTDAQLCSTLLCFNGSIPFFTYLETLDLSRERDARREDPSQERGGATTVSKNSLPTYMFIKINKKHNKHENNKEIKSSSGEGGVAAAGTKNERVLSEEDAMCCICLTKYENNDELRELPCTHFFHKDCVDIWLKINALCPYCKNKVGESVSSSH